MPSWDRPQKKAPNCAPVSSIAGIDDILDDAVEVEFRRERAAGPVEDFQRGGLGAAARSVRTDTWRSSSAALAACS